MWIIRKRAMLLTSPYTNYLNHIFIALVAISIRSIIKIFIAIDVPIISELIKTPMAIGFLNIHMNFSKGTISFLFSLNFQHENLPRGLEFSHQKFSYKTWYPQKNFIKIKTIYDFLPF